MPGEDIRLLILSTAGLFAFILGFIIYFIVLYRNRQLKNKQEQEQQESAFRQELLKTQIEVQEQTLHYISSEIHDNITQVLSFIKLNLAMISGKDEDQNTRIRENRELVAQVITDLRDLSKSLSYEHIINLGLVETIEIESQKVNKSDIIKLSLLIEGEVYLLGSQCELVLFRIFQEALNNTLKHSGAKHFKITLQYHPEIFNLTLEDDGNGFSAGSFNKGNGLGLRNMENRAMLIGAVATIDSRPGKGCNIKISLNPSEQRLYANEYHPDSIG